MLNSMTINLIFTCSFVVALGGPTSFRSRDVGLSSSTRVSARSFPSIHNRAYHQGLRLAPSGRYAVPAVAPLRRSIVSLRQADRYNVAHAAMAEEAPIETTKKFNPLAILVKPIVLLIVALARVLMFVLYPVLFPVIKWLETPSRPYATNQSVGSAYDDWTREGILEHYWGEHIHMGSYTSLAQQKGYSKNDDFITAFLRATYGWLANGLKDFKAAKYDFSAEMLEWSGAKSPKKILDVGCGIGGTSRYLAKRFPDAEILGITLSPEQVKRATGLAKEAGLNNVKFQVTNALNMTFKDDSFDLVWGCESGEHMPDKKKYVEEMARVLAPGGNMVIATWCERDPIPPFTPEERKHLDFMYEEWAHPFFISISSYKKLMADTGKLMNIETADWVERTLPSWRHSIWVGAWSPWFWMKLVAKNPVTMLRIIREIYTLEKYHKAMVDGLMGYGMMKAVKQR